MSVDRSTPQKVVASYCAAMFAIGRDCQDASAGGREVDTTPLYERGERANTAHCTRPHRMDSLGWPSPYGGEITEVAKISDDRVEVHTLRRETEV
jgi:hypothetical protein